MDITNQFPYSIHINDKNYQALENMDTDNI